MTLLNDGMRSLAHNFRTVLLGLLSLTVVLGSYHFANAIAASAALPVDAVAHTPTGSPPSAAGTANTAEAPSQPMPASTSGLGDKDIQGDKDSHGDTRDDAPPPVWYLVYQIVSDVLFAAGISVVYAVIFSLLARSIDRPLWKCEVPGEAVRRFFEPWFLMSLISLGIQTMAARSGSADVALTLELFYLVWSAFIIPIGACVMMYGRLDWEHFGEALSPIARQFGAFMLVIAISIVQYIVQMASIINLPVEKTAYFERAAKISMMTPAFAIFDLLMFCIAWRIVVLDRDAPRVSSDDFDD